MNGVWGMNVSECEPVCVCVCDMSVKCCVYCSIGTQFSDPMPSKRSLCNQGPVRAWLWLNQRCCSEACLANSKKQCNITSKMAAADSVEGIH